MTDDDIKELAECLRMTDDDIKELAEWLGIPGRALVHYVGWWLPSARVFNPHIDCYVDPGREVKWQPREDIAHAWIIVETMRGKGFQVTLRSTPDSQPDDMYRVYFSDNIFKLGADGAGISPVAPTAIVEAALAVMRGE